MRTCAITYLGFYVFLSYQQPRARRSEHVVINEDYVLIGIVTHWHRYSLASLLTGIVTHWHRYSLGTKNSYLRGTPVKVISEAKSSIKN